MTVTALPALTRPGFVGLLAGPESDKAGPLGLLTIVLLCIAVYFLYRSMVRHMKKVPESFDEPPTDSHRPGQDSAEPGPAGGDSAGRAEGGP